MPALDKRVELLESILVICKWHLNNIRDNCPHNELDNGQNCKKCGDYIDWRGKYYREKDTYYRVQKAPST